MWTTVFLCGEADSVIHLNTCINTGYSYHVTFYLPGAILMVKAVALFRVPHEPSCGLVIIPEQSDPIALGNMSHLECLSLTR